jgi:hypothetical protein
VFSRGRPSVVAALPFALKPYQTNWGEGHIAAILRRLEVRVQACLRKLGASEGEAENCLFGAGSPAS